jgi:hypothetical protein
MSGPLAAVGAQIRWLGGSALGGRRTLENGAPNVAGAPCRISEAASPTGLRRVASPTGQALRQTRRACARGCTTSGRRPCFARRGPKRSTTSISVASAHLSTAASRTTAAKTEILVSELGNAPRRRRAALQIVAIHVARLLATPRSTSRRGFEILTGLVEQRFSFRA